MQVFSGIGLGFMVCVGAVALVGIFGSPDEGGDAFSAVWFLAWTGFVLYEAWNFFFRMPQRIEVTSAELRFVARTRTVEVPWPSLRSVRSPWYDFGGQTLQWRWDGGKMRTYSRYEQLHRLLTIIEERAPQADVSGA